MSNKRKKDRFLGALKDLQEGAKASTAPGGPTGLALDDLSDNFDLDELNNANASSANVPPNIGEDQQNDVDRAEEFSEWFNATAMAERKQRLPDLTKPEYAPLAVAFMHDAMDHGDHLPPPKPLKVVSQWTANIKRTHGPFGCFEEYKMPVGSSAPRTRETKLFTVANHFKSQYDEKKSLDPSYKKNEGERAAVTLLADVETSKLMKEAAKGNKRIKSSYYEPTLDGMGLTNENNGGGRHLKDPFADYRAPKPVGTCSKPPIDGSEVSPKNFDPRDNDWSDHLEENQSELTKIKDLSKLAAGIEAKLASYIEKGVINDNTAHSGLTAENELPSMYKASSEFESYKANAKERGLDTKYWDDQIKEQKDKIEEAKKKNSG